jgi:DNA repair protein RAD5
VDPGARAAALGRLRGVLGEVVLRRTKAMPGPDGLPLVPLPPRNVEVVYLEHSPEEARARPTARPAPPLPRLRPPGAECADRPTATAALAQADFYRALHTRSRTEFESFVAAGTVLAKYAHVLLLLLRMRQAACHPFLTLSRADTDNDLGKLLQTSGFGAKKAATVGGVEGGAGGGGSRASATFLRSVVAELSQPAAAGAEARECPLCLEGVEDAVVTRCGHVMCRECVSAMVFTQPSQHHRCPICREPLDKDSLLTVPRSSRFATDIEANWTTSTKVEALLAEVEAGRRRGSAKHGDGSGPFKAVVFSQWTSFLDLLEVRGGGGGWGGGSARHAATPCPSTPRHLARASPPGRPLARSR